MTLQVAEPGFEEKLQQIVLQHVPGCTAFKQVERLSGGASQETYRLVIDSDEGEKRLAMRRSPGGQFNERTPQHPGLDVEALLMRSALEVGVPEPEVYHVLTLDDGLGEGFIMEWIEGEALGARIVKAAEFNEIRPRLAYECGKILAKIHSINLDATGLRDKLWEIPPDEFVAQTWERYQLLESPQPMIDYAASWLKAHVPTNYETRLVHNDFRNGNFMLLPDGISSVLDWEVAHIGDPMRDLGWICTNSWRFGRPDPVGGFGSYEDLFRGYEEQSGRRVDPEHVRFWEVFGSFWWAVGSLGMGEHYRSGPDKTVERPAIARRSSECQIDCANLLIPGDIELVAESAAFSSLDLPRTDELLLSVRDFLRGDVMAVTEGRTNFLARVASNSVDIVLRELTLGPEHQRLELLRLQKLYQSEDDIMTLRARLSAELRSNVISLENEELQVHLRLTVANQVAIDQPKYSGLQRAMNYAG